jgi:type IV secretion system protein VirB6
MIRRRLLSYIFIFFTLLPLNARAGSFNDILTSISAISCETLYLVKQSYFPHTCIPAAYSTTYIANIVSPGLYSWAMSRLTINDEELLPGNCKRENRTDPYDPHIEFSFCSNILLVPLRLQAINNIVVNLLVDAVNGKDPWNNIAKNWYIDPKKYHSMDGLIPGSRNLPLGSSGVFVDLNLAVFTDALNVDPSNTGNVTINRNVPVVVFPWQVVRSNDTICVATIGITGWLPVGCKYMKDPYLVSRYHNFFHSLPPDAPTGDATLQNATNNVGLSLTSSSSESGLVSCLSNSCYINTMMNTKTLVPIAGPIVSCVQQMLTKVLISQDICSFDQYSAIISNSTARSKSTLYAFQDSMRNAVMALLTMYVMFVGFKILLGGEIPEKGELIKYLVKLILVIYFSIGINIQGSDTAVDGMSQWILPIVFDGASAIASWITHASPSQLCVFSPSDYAPGYGYLALWDALDCRISNYLGIDQLGAYTSRNAQGTPDFDALRATIPPWVILLFPAIYSGNLQLVMLVLSYPLLVISTAAYMVYAFIVCLISITILAVLAPVFIPMVLFEYTKSYFDSWVKLIISFVLQPMVVSTFMIVMFTVYDFGFFGTCKFKPLNVTQSVDGTNVTRKMFALNNNMNDQDAYPNADAVRGCTNSLGWIFNAPFGIISGSVSPESAGTIISDQASTYVDPLVKQISNISPTDGGVEVAVGTTTPPDQTFDDNANQYSILSSVKTKQGLFFPITTLVGSLRDFIFSLFTACFCLYLLKQLSEQVAEFAADMTEGIAIPGAKIPPPKPPEDKDKDGGKEGADDTSAPGDSDKAEDTTARGGIEGASDTATKGTSPRSSDTNVPHGTRAQASDTAIKTSNDTKGISGTTNTPPADDAQKTAARDAASSLVSEATSKAIQNVAATKNSEVQSAASSLVSGATSKAVDNVVSSVTNNRTKATIAKGLDKAKGGDDNK